VIRPRQRPLPLLRPSWQSKWDVGDKSTYSFRPLRRRRGPKKPARATAMPAHAASTPKLNRTCQPMRPGEEEPGGVLGAPARVGVEARAQTGRPEPQREAREGNGEHEAAATHERRAGLVAVGLLVRSQCPARAKVGDKPPDALGSSGEGVCAGG
jgi:hypothetical protein